MRSHRKYGKRSKALQKLRMDLISGPSAKEIEAWVLTDSEIKALNNYKLMAGEGGPSNFHEFRHF